MNNLGDSRAILRPGYHYCWNCGRGPRERLDHWYGPWMIQIAHIASGQGRAVRVDAKEAVVGLCPLCHECHVSDADRLPFKHICGNRWPTIDERHTLFIKKQVDPENWSQALLDEIWIGIPPEPQRPPDFWCREFTSRTGILR